MKRDRKFISVGIHLSGQLPNPQREPRNIPKTDHVLFVLEHRTYQIGGNFTDTGGLSCGTALAST